MPNSLILADYQPKPLALDQAPAGALAARNDGGPSLLRAQTDVEAAATWLAQYHAHPGNTQRNYAREVERLLLWLDWQGLTLKEMALEDVQNYLQFLLNPAPRSMWCIAPTHADKDSTRLPPRFGPDGKTRHPEWRPFVSGLAPSSAALARRCINRFFEFLVATRYLLSNPLRAIPRPPRAARQSPTRITRYLDAATRAHLLGYVEQLPADTPVLRAYKERARFILTWYHLLGLRIAEMAAARTDDIRCDRTRDQERYWLTVTNKGKTAEIPVKTDAIEALKAYRRSFGKYSMADPGKNDPIVWDVYGRRPVSVKSLHQVVKDLFRGAAETTGDPGIRNALLQASTHWLRHSSASAQVAAGIPLHIVRSNMRHDSIATTNLYLHTEMDTQHDVTEQFKF